MDKFVIRKPSKPAKRGSADGHASSDSDIEQQPPQKVAATSSSVSLRMRTYENNLTYKEEWKKQHPWMDYDSYLKGMVCTVCKTYGKVPVQARGARVTRPVNNWVKTTTLLNNHEKSEWHLAAVEKGALNQSVQEHGDVVDIIVTASEEEKKQNRELMKKLIQSQYFLVKHYIPHTTTFESFITLQIENGDIKLKSHRETCPGDATYESYATVVELLTSISKTLETTLLGSLKASTYYSLMADERTDVASEEDLSMCAHWLQQNKPVEHFLGIVHAKETNAQAVAGYLCDFMKSKDISFENLCELGFDGTNTMLGHRSGVQTCLRVHAPSAIYVHCRCQQLQLAAVNAAEKHVQVKRVLGHTINNLECISLLSQKSCKACRDTG